jgi:hypothetical protein
MAEAAANSENNGNAKIYSRADVQDALSAIAVKIMESQAAFLHSMLFLDRLLRLPNAGELFSGDLKTQARDLWLKAKSAGLQLEDPPLLAAGTGGDKQ